MNTDQDDDGIFIFYQFSHLRIHLNEQELKLKLKLKIPKISNSISLIWYALCLKLRQMELFTSAISYQKPVQSYAHKFPNLLFVERQESFDKQTHTILRFVHLLNYYFQSTFIYHIIAIMCEFNVSKMRKRQKWGNKAAE